LGVAFTSHSIKLRGQRKSAAIPLLPLWVFMACSRVNVTFTFTLSVEVEAYGSSSDSDAFKNEKFGKLLQSNKLIIPDPIVLSSDAGLSVPIALVGDEAFALSEHVLRPYLNKSLTFLKLCVPCFFNIDSSLIN
jgi:hypothetical protein